MKELPSFKGRQKFRGPSPKFGSSNRQMGLPYSSDGKDLPAMQETQVRSLGQADSPGEGNGNRWAPLVPHSWSCGKASQSPSTPPIAVATSPHSQDLTHSPAPPLIQPPWPTLCSSRPPTLSQALAPTSLSAQNAILSRAPSQGSESPEVVIKGIHSNLG